jgi:hypothetical protein
MVLMWSYHWRSKCLGTMKEGLNCVKFPYIPDHVYSFASLFLELMCEGYFHIVLKMLIWTRNEVLI